MIKFLEKFERIIVFILIIMMSVLILLATANLGWQIILNIIQPPVAFIPMHALLDLFGLFLLILIGIELIETIKVFITSHIIRVETVMLVAIIAASRKIIIIDIDQVSDLLLIGMGFLIVSLTAGYYFIRKSHKDNSKL